VEIKNDLVALSDGKGNFELLVGESLGNLK